MTDTSTPRAVALIDELIAALAQSHMTIAALVAETHRLRREVADRDGRIADLYGQLAGGTR